MHRINQTGKNNCYLRPISIYDLHATHWFLYQMNLSITIHLILPFFFLFVMSTRVNISALVVTLNFNCQMRERFLISFFNSEKWISTAGELFPWWSRKCTRGKNFVVCFLQQLCSCECCWQAFRHQVLFLSNEKQPQIIVITIVMQILTAAKCNQRFTSSILERSKTSYTYLSKRWKDINIMNTLIIWQFSVNNK